MLLIRPNLFSLPLYTIPRSSRLPQIFLMTFSHPIRKRPVLRSALDGWPISVIFGSLLSFIGRTCPSVLNLFLIIALVSRVEPYFSHSLLFEIQSISWVSKTIRKQFQGYHSLKELTIGLFLLIQVLFIFIK